MSEALNEAVAWRLTQLERTVEALEGKVDRLTWALALAAVSFAVTTATFLFTIHT